MAFEIDIEFQNNKKLRSWVLKSNNENDIFKFINTSLGNSKEILILGLQLTKIPSLTSM